MMEKFIAIHEEKIGKRRTGFMCYVPKIKEFFGLTEKQIKEKIKGGDEVIGLKLDDQGAIIVDMDFTEFMLSRSGINTFAPMDGMDCEINKSFTLVLVIKHKTGNKYRLVSNRYGIEDACEDKINAMLLFMQLGGIKMVDGKLTIHKDVEIINTDANDVSE